MKKTPSKVAHNRPPTFFFITGPAAQTAQKQKFRTPKSPKTPKPQNPKNMKINQAFVKRANIIYLFID
jgi:hypothetical protein